MCFPTPKVWFAIRWLFWVRVTYDHVVISTKKMKIIQGKKCKNGKVWKTNDLREMHASFDLLFAILHRGHAWWRWFYFSHAKATRNGLCLLKGWTANDFASFFFFLSHSFNHISKMLYLVSYISLRG